MLHIGFLYLWSARAALLAAQELLTVGASLVNSAQALGAQTLVVVAHGLQSVGSVVVIPGPGIKSVSPASRFFNTGPLGKPGVTLIKKELESCEENGKRVVGCEFVYRKQNGLCVLL